MNESANTTRTAPLLVLGSLGVASTLICASAAIAVFAHGLHRRLLYRLALYQVLGSLMHSVLLTLQLVFINYGSNTDAYRPLCVAVGFLFNASHWIKLLALIWLTLHVFSFAMCYRNSKKLEVVFVIVLLIFPFVISAVPFATKSYGQTSTMWCWIVQNTNSTVSRLMQLMVWLLPATALLLLTLALVITMLSVLGFRIYGELKSEVRVAIGPRKKALKQLFPLLAYPIAFIVFLVPALTFSFAGYLNAGKEALYRLALLTAVSVPMWSTSSGITLLVLILCYRCGKRERKKTENYGGVSHPAKT